MFLYTRAPVTVCFRYRLKLILCSMLEVKTKAQPKCNAGKFPLNYTMLKFASDSYLRVRQRVKGPTHWAPADQVQLKNYKTSTRQSWFK